MKKIERMTSRINIEDIALSLSEMRSSLERVERMVGKLLAAPYKMASSRLQSAMNELLCHDYKRAYESLDKVIDLTDEAFHCRTDNNLDKDSFRDICRLLRMAAFAKILKYSYCEEKKIFKPYFLLEENSKRLISSELETLGRKSQ